MILGDILNEYKAKIIAWGRMTFTLLVITGVATIIISYVFYSMAQIVSKGYGQVVVCKSEYPNSYFFVDHKYT